MRLLLLPLIIGAGVFLGLWAFMRWAQGVGGVVPVGFGGRNP